MRPPAARRATVSDVAAIEGLVDDAFGHYVERIRRKPAPMTHDYRALLSTARVGDGRRCWCAPKRTPANSACPRCGCTPTPR